MASSITLSFSEYCSIICTANWLRWLATATYRPATLTRLLTIAAANGHSWTSPLTARTPVNVAQKILTLFGHLTV